MHVGHVFGTIHINDERVTRIPKVVSDIFNESKGYAIEAFPSSHLWNPYHGWQDIKKRMMLTEGKTLEDVAGKDLANSVQRIMTNNGVTADYAKKIKERKKNMADPNKYKSLSVNIIDWQDLGTIASRTNRTRSKMIARLIRFYKENRGEKKNGRVDKKAG